MNPWLRILFDLGPLVVFFLVNMAGGIYWATGAFMVAIAFTLGLGYVRERKISPMAAVTAVVVLLFGTLTLALEDETFIKIKPTIIYLLFASILLIGLITGRTYIKYLFQAAFTLDESGWRKLTLRWGLFFVALAIVNELVWRNFSTDFWVAFKLWGAAPATFIFALLQTPLVLRHHHEPPPAPAETPPPPAGTPEP